MAWLGLLRGVPREAWYILAALAAWWFVSAHYIEQGREEVLTELRKAEAEAKSKAEAAVTVADEKAIERAEVEAEVIERQIDAIEQAEANNENALDALF